MVIGAPAEIPVGETRVVLTTVPSRKWVTQGHTGKVQVSAGAAAR
jgi:alanine dehydrogenase